VSIAPESQAEHDALYVHTPNANGTSFTHRFEGVQWNVLPPPLLRAFLEGEAWEVGAATGEWIGWWIVRSRSLPSLNSTRQFLRIARPTYRTPPYR
jgi:hypothetical protein